MNACWWCSHPTTYAHGLCHSCYRWFYRHPYLDDSDYCNLCNKFITKRNISGTCKKCSKILKLTGYVPKRIGRLENKFEEIVPFMKNFNTKESAQIALSSIFKPKQQKILDALLERYYNKVTLQYIADQWNVSREYVRQCENTAINIIKAVFLES